MKFAFILMILVDSVLGEIPHDSNLPVDFSFSVHKAVRAKLSNLATITHGIKLYDQVDKDAIEHSIKYKNYDLLQNE